MKTLTHTDNMHLSKKQFHVSLQLLFETFFALTNISGINIQETRKKTRVDLHVKESTTVPQNWNGDQVS